MAVNAVFANETFQMGQFKAQLLTFSTGTDGTHIIDRTLLRPFSQIFGIFDMASQATRIYYTLQSDGRPASVVVTGSTTTLQSVLIIGE